jgi:hypothetical protein
MTLEEAELLRAICAALHCPLPPLLMRDNPCHQVTGFRDPMSALA